MLKRESAISTPVVEEKPGLEVCPPPFTAQGTLADEMIDSYGEGECLVYMYEAKRAYDSSNILRCTRLDAAGRVLAAAWCSWDFRALRIRYAGSNPWVLL